MARTDPQQPPPSRHLEIGIVGERRVCRSDCTCYPVCSSSSSTATATRTANAARDRERLGGYSLVCFIMHTSRLRMLRPAVFFHRLAACFSPRPNSLPLHRNLAMANSDWATVPQHDSVPRYSIFSKSIEKSPFDQRHYRVIRLDNGLTAMLVHDPHTENAAASLDVAVGHLSDPVSDSSSPRFILSTHAHSPDFSRTICQVWLTSASTCYSWYAELSLPRFVSEVLRPV